jgi:hypothetical protein
VTLLIEQGDGKMNRHRVMGRQFPRQKNVLSFGVIRDFEFHRMNVERDVQITKN